MLQSYNSYISKSFKFGRSALGVSVNPPKRTVGLSFERLLLIFIATQVACSVGVTRDGEDLSGWLYYQSENSDRQEVHRVRPNGTKHQVIFGHEEDAFVYRGAPERDQLLIVTGHDGEHDIVLSDLLGKSKIKLAAAPGLDWYPRISPDGASVLFESARSSYRDLYRVKIDGGQTSKLTDNREGNFDGVWSPDGKEIAFASSRMGQLDLYIMDADGQNQKRLTKHPGDSIKPQWSKDGRSLFFISARDGYDAIFEVQKNGTNLRRVTPAESVVTRFSISEDGKKILYASSNDGSIWIHNLNTKKELRLGLGVDPVWSPDARHIAYAYKSNIYVINQNGSKRWRVTSSSSIDWRPLWLK